MSDNRPIGVFDSGAGGLTVLQALQQRLPHESTVYLGDLARCPYGVRPPEEVRAFTLQMADLLAAQNIKLLVIACNTATAAAYTSLLGRYAFPVIGVVDPGAAAAVRLTQSGRIGVVATEVTVRSGAYGHAIRERLADAVVIEREASWLVPLVEWGPLARSTVALELAPVLEELRRNQIDVLILGCTHFPIVRDIFEQEIGPEIPVLDSAQTTAEDVARALEDLEMTGDGPAHHRVLVTGPAEVFAERARLMFRSSPSIETVSAELDTVP